MALKNKKEEEKKMALEAAEKKLVFVRVDPDNAKQIEDASFCEREGFGTGLDPQELPAILRWLAKRGTIWLQYAVEGGKYNPTGVDEFIALMEARKYRPRNINPEEFDLSRSPFHIIMANRQRCFAAARRFAKDEDIIYCHGIAMSRRGKGYGTLLNEYALKNTPGISGSAIVAFIDAAKFDQDSGLQLAPNEDSFTFHVKAGFVLISVVDPPVYDETLTYYSFIKPARSFNLPGRANHESLNLAQGDAKSVLEKVRQLTKEGFVGKYYDKLTHTMKFQRPSKL